MTDIVYDDFTPIDRALCRQCNAECCDSTTPFLLSDIKLIKQKHRKLLKGVKIIPSVGDTFILKKRDNDKCVFLNQENRCMIYNIRPEICSDFGDKPYCLCAYNGLKTIPTDKKELDALAAKAQKTNTERLAERIGVKVKVNMINPSAENVLSATFLRDTLDFRKK